MGHISIRERRQNQMARQGQGNAVARAKRTLDQNAYYWAVLTEFQQDHGWDTPEDVHEFFKGMFLRKHYSLPNGIRCETIGSTARLTTVEFGDYMDKCKYWCYHKAEWTWPAPKHLGM